MREYLGMMADGVIHVVERLNTGYGGHGDIVFCEAGYRATLGKKVHLYSEMTVFTCIACITRLSRKEHAP